jgi:hypothetical protein
VYTFVRDSAAPSRTRTPDSGLSRFCSGFDRADVERARTLALDLEMREVRAVLEQHFGHRVREVARLARRDVALDHRRLRVPLGHDERARFDWVFAASRRTRT